MKDKIGGLFGGIVAGVLMIIIGIGVLWWNEGRTVKVQKGINEAKDVYVQVKSDKVDSKYEGKLIATNGKMDLSESEELVDEVFGIKASSALMERNVEMYQWEEDCTTDDNNNKKCTYKKEWSDRLIDSSDFEKAEKHTNPDSMPYESEEFVAENVKMGAFVLPDSLVKRLSTKKTKTNEELTNEAKEIEGYRIDKTYITNVKEEEDAQIGDVRISFNYNDATSVSILAVQTGDTFSKFTTKSGTSVFRIKEGTHTGDVIIKDMTDENNVLKWLLRLVGVLLEIIGIGALLSPLQKLTNFIPLVGSAVSAVTGLVSLLAGLAISLVVIAIAWLRFRPILSISLLVVVAILIFILLKLKKKTKEEVPAVSEIIEAKDGE